MGWLKDLFHGIATFFRRMFEGIADMIQQLTKRLRYLRIKWTMDLAEWLEDDFNFMLGIAVLIVGSILLPKIIAYVKEIIGKVAVKALIMFGLNEGFTQRQLRTLLNLEAMSDIAKVIFPEYKMALGQLNKALGDFAGELKFGQGYIHSYLSMTRGVLSGSIALFGLPPEMVEYDWWTKSSEWAATIEDRLEEYAMNPHRMFGDIIEEILLPLQETYTASQQKELDEIYTKLERMNEIREGISTIESSLSTWIDELPDEIGAVFDEKIGPALQDVRDTMEQLDSEVFNKIKATVDRLQELEDDNKRLQGLMDEKKTDPLELIDQAALMNAREAKSFSEWVIQSITPSLDEIDQQGRDDFIPDMAKHLPEPPKEDEIMAGIALTSYNQANIIVPAQKGTIGKDSWFVGEY